MTKNVTVTDENGTYVGTTYPKRAKGLVKNGRALFLDDCTIRLSGKTEPSDDKINQSEVKQMNYIYFNPREWSYEQTQYNTQYNNGNGFCQPGFHSQASVERCYINDFDGGLIESLMFGGWDEAYTKVTTGHFSFLPDTEYCFVFWLNGGENDRNNEICQLQISYSGNPGDCCTYKLNRNYIKPLLHKQGWELYSIPFVTPASEQPTVDTRFSFVAGNAPMAIKPAKDPTFYKEWEDEPDEFAQWRPQRHNLVFEDGWPDITMYGGDKYSTEVLRSRKRQFVSPQHRQMMQGMAENVQQAAQGVAENVQQVAQGFAVNAKQMAKDLAQSTRQMAEHYRESAGQRKNQAEHRAELAELLTEYRDKQTELTTRQEELSERRLDLQMRYNELLKQYRVGENEKSRLNAGFDETADEMPALSALHALDAQFTCASNMVSMQDVPIEAAEGVLNGIESQLNSVTGMCSKREEILDELETILNRITEQA